MLKPQFKTVLPTKPRLCSLQRAPLGEFSETPGALRGPLPSPPAAGVSGGRGCRPGTQQTRPCRRRVSVLLLAPLHVSSKRPRSSSCSDSSPRRRPGPLLLPRAHANSPNCKLDLSWPTSAHLSAHPLPSLCHLTRVGCSGSHPLLALHPGWASRRVNQECHSPACTPPWLPSG